MLNNKKKSILLSILITIGVLSTLAFSYAYVRLDASGNEQKISSSTAALTLIYDECQTNVGTCSDVLKNLKVGDSVIRYFSINNISQVDFNASLYFTTLKNTFLNNELVYEIKNVDTNEVVFSGVVPYSFDYQKDALITNLNVPASTTTNYAIKVTFISINDDQNYNLDATYYFELGIK